MLVIATHYQIEVSDRKLKETIKATVKAGLQKKGVLGCSESSQGVSVGLTFEQQKELLQLKQQHELALEEQKQKIELARINLQQDKLRLIKDGLLPSESLESDSHGHPGLVPPSDITRYLRLLPKCNEKDPDIFYFI